MEKSDEIVVQKTLDAVYEKYHKPVLVAPDPLQFVRGVQAVREREITALIAASLAYGRVEQILKAVTRVLAPMHGRPLDYVCMTPERDIAREFQSFKYRFATGDHLTSLIMGMRDVIHRFGSLETCFVQGQSPTDETVLPALTFFTRELTRVGNPGHLTARPEKGSACKRSHLFLRWMVRKDAVDPGGWQEVSPARLIIPLDTHMHRAGRLLGFTTRKQADMKTALEVTRGFKSICPDDPVKYDFSLTRFGIHPDMDVDDLKDMMRE